MKNIFTYKKFNENMSRLGIDRLTAQDQTLQYNPKILTNYFDDPVNFPEYEKIKDIFEDLSDWCYQNLKDFKIEIYKELNRIDPNTENSYISISQDNLYHHIKDDNIYYKTYYMFLRNIISNLPPIFFKPKVDNEYVKKFKISIERLKRCGFEVYKKHNYLIRIVDKDDLVYIEDIINYKE